jgi:hypothetical protein
MSNAVIVDVVRLASGPEEQTLPPPSPSWSPTPRHSSPVATFGSTADSWEPEKKMMGVG